MTETTFRLRIIPNQGAKPIFADLHRLDYDALLVQSKVEGTFKVYLVRSIFNNEKVRITPMKKIQKHIHPNQPFLTQREEDMAWGALRRKLADDDRSISEDDINGATDKLFYDAHGFEHNTFEYYPIKL